MNDKINVNISKEKINDKKDIDCNKKPRQGT